MEYILFVFHCSIKTTRKRQPPYKCKTPRHSLPPLMSLLIQPPSLSSPPAEPLPCSLPAGPLPLCHTTAVAELTLTSTTIDEQPAPEPTPANLVKRGAERPTTTERHRRSAQRARSAWEVNGRRARPALQAPSTRQRGLEAVSQAAWTCSDTEAHTQTELGVSEGAVRASAEPQQGKTTSYGGGGDYREELTKNWRPQPRHPQATRRKRRAAICGLPHKSQQAPSGTTLIPLSVASYMPKRDGAYFASYRSCTIVMLNTKTQYCIHAPSHRLEQMLDCMLDPNTKSN